MIPVTISYERACALKKENVIFEIWKMHAHERNLSLTTIQQVKEAWMAGDTSLLISLPVWEALISDEMEQALTAKEDTYEHDSED